MDVPFALPTKGTASTPRIYCSKQFQVCTHPGSFNPADLKSISRSGATCRNIGFLQQKVADLEWEALIARSPKTLIGMIPTVISGGGGSAPFFWRGSISQYNSTRRRFTTLEGDCFFFFFLFGADFHVHRQRLICISSESPPPSPPSLARSCGFHNTVAAWLKQRSPRQVNNQPTQSAVCDRFHANKAFSNSLLRGSTRRGLSDCSLLITINL